MSETRSLEEPSSNSLIYLNATRWLGTMLKKLNAGEYEEVPSQMKRWNKAGGKVLQGLIRRREAESLLFEGKDWSEI